MNYKKMLSYILILIIVICVTGCGSKNDAKEALDIMMQGFKTGDAEKINEYYDFDEISRFINPNKQDEMLLAVLNILPEMDYSILSADRIDSNTVGINLKIKTLDFSHIMNMYIQEVENMVDNSEYKTKLSTITQEEYQGLLADKMLYAINQNDADKIVKTVYVTMKKQNGKWYMSDGNESFLRAMFGNLIDAVNSLL